MYLTVCSLPINDHVLSKCQCLREVKVLLMTNKRAVSNLFTEAAGVGRRLVFGEQNETRE